MKTALVAAAAGLAVCGLLAGCGSSPQHINPARQPGTTRADHSSTRSPADSAEGNRAEAAALIHRMLNLMPLPPGSVAVPDASPSDDGPAMGTPGASDFVNISASWRVPMAYTDVEAWARSHLPAGFTEAGSMTDGGPNNTGLGVQFNAPSDPAAPDNEAGALSLSASPIAGQTDVSTWRVDASDVWYDPTPVRVAAGGARIHFSVSQGCPKSVGTATDVSNSASGLDTAMLPPGAPTGALVCEFASSNPPPIGRKASTRILDAAQAVKLSAQARALRLGTSGGVYNCPMDQGDVTLIALAYPQGDIDLWWHVDGCPSVDNGTISAFFGSLTVPS